MASFHVLYESGSKYRLKFLTVPVENVNGMHWVYRYKKSVIIDDVAVEIDKKEFNNVILYSEVFSTRVMLKAFELGYVYRAGDSIRAVVEDLFELEKDTVFETKYFDFVGVRSGECVTPYKNVVYKFHGAKDMLPYLYYKDFCVIDSPQSKEFLEYNYRAYIDRDYDKRNAKLCKENNVLYIHNIKNISDVINTLL
jgi:hypothetical protein